MTDLERMEFEFCQDNVADKSPADLGRYVAGMAVRKTQLTATLALICAIKGYSSDQIAEAESAFDDACQTYRKAA